MSAPPLRDQILARSARAGVALHPDQADKLVAYYTLLERWNQKINLTALPLAARADATLDRLLVEPLIAAAQVEDVELAWLDFGSGGGSPAIPLKIVKPKAALTMVEAKERKAAFLREAVSILALANSAVSTARIEGLIRTGSGADLITLRAVRPSPEVLGAAGKILRMHGRLLLFRSAGPAPLIAGFEAVAETGLGPASGILSTFRKTS